MKDESLFDTNPHLKDPVQFRDDLIRSVATSTAIETGASVEEISKDLRTFWDAGFPPLKVRHNRARKRTGSS